MDLDLDAFIRTLTVNKDVGNILFTGAGASISSGVPSAEICIWDWKRRIFLSRNPGLESQFSELSLEFVKTRIQDWLRLQGEFPVLGATSEYSVYAEKCFPIASDRKKYFEEISLKAIPALGYRLLPLLVSANIFRESWTTNFDGIAERVSSTSNKSIISIGHDSIDRLNRPINESEFLSVCLHGDYRYDSIKNTDAEFADVRRADETLREKLKEKLKNQNLIVIGYSGRDVTVMETLASAYSSQGNGRLYWCVYDDDNVSESVERLMKLARSSGREAYLIRARGFDDLLCRFSYALLPESKRTQVEEIIGGSGIRTTTEPFKISAPYTATLIKSNLLHLLCPPDILKVECTIPEGDSKWEFIRELRSDLGISAGILKGSVYCLGDLDYVAKKFGAWSIRDISRVQIDERDLRYSDGVVSSILNEAVVKGLASKFNLQTDGRSTLWSDTKGTAMTILGEKVRVFTSLRIRFRSFNKRHFLVLDPNVICLDLNGKSVTKEIGKEASRQLLGRQWNKQFDEDLERWISSFFTGSNLELEFPFASKTFGFKISRTRQLGQVLTHRRPQYEIDPANFTGQIGFQGATFKEPNLKFSTKDGSGSALDFNGLRGLVRNRPFDYPLTQRGLSTEVKIAVICEKGHEQKLARFLNTLHSATSASSKTEYLINFPGFANCLGAALAIPSFGDPGWITVETSGLGRNPFDDSKKLVSVLTNSIDQAISSYNPNIVLLFVPAAWAPLESISESKFNFDLHDSVKAFSVQRGIATQFLRQNTLDKPHQAEILWWLALSIYIKSRRSPWILDGIEPDTAFAGIGYSVKYRDNQSSVLLGCSHIYTAEGVGLNYKLSKVENPIFRKRNPYLSEDDARRVGEGIRQLYFESKRKLPERVVIHKFTPFLREEITGLTAGLSGVRSIDLLELSYDSMTKFTAQTIRGSSISPYMFPVNRGTALISGRNEMLLWLHGNSAGLNANRSYYLGKNRIPAPMIVRRHLGNTPMQQISFELMGLSKLGLNSFDLYNRVPATLDSSSAIARIGSLLDRFGSSVYDYRLFI